MNAMSISAKSLTMLSIIHLQLTSVLMSASATIVNRGGRKLGLKQPAVQPDASESFLIWKAPEATPSPNISYYKDLVVPVTDHRADWAEFNTVLHPYFISDNFVTQTTEATQVLSVTAQQPWVKTICETGFGAGHSAMLFLLANPKAEVYSFGWGNHSYTKASERFLHHKFGDRFTLTRGDSRKTLPFFRHMHPGVQCDLVFVDGSYDAGSSHADIRNLRRMTNPVNQVLFVMDTPCPAKWCIGRGTAFSQAVESKEIVPVSRLPVNELHGLSSAWFTPVAPPHAVPASNFETLGSKSFLAATSGGNET